ncbi:MAG: response regulator, partial [Lachnospiraceae bacterium]|nr:response regulator [Lachnospiraceae bacterium]
MAQLRVIIIDDDRNRREEVERFLPSYMDTVAVGSGDGAIDHIKRDEDGVIPDLVIVNGDDPKHFGLYVFDWMVNRSGDDDIASIPVIVLTEDEFSDRCLEFLEIGDVMFYEGDIDEGGIFTAVTDRMEESDFRAEPVEPSYEETRSLDRLMGHSVKAPGDGQRAVVIDMDERIRNLEAALQRGRKRVEDIRAVLDVAQKTKNGKIETVLRHDEKRNARDKASIAKMSSFLQKARERAEAASTVDNLRQKAIVNPEGAFNAQGTVRMEERP